MFKHWCELGIGKSYLVLLVLGKPKRWERSSRKQTACTNLNISRLSYVDKDNKKVIWWLRKLWNSS